MFEVFCEILGLQCRLDIRLEEVWVMGLLFPGPKQRTVNVSVAVTSCIRKQANPERQPPLVHDLEEVNKGSGNFIFIPMLLKKVGKCNR